MNTLYALLFLVATAFAVNPHDILPCAFEVMTYTHVMSGGEEISKSIDAIYHDHDNLWRWDSEFKGVPGFFDGHTWRIIWRPDDGASYHDMVLEDKCVTHSGKDMYPYPLDWILGKTDKMEWSATPVEYEGQSAIRYTGIGSSTQYSFKVCANVYFLKSGQLVYGNGTVESSLIDISFTMDVTKFVSNSPLPADTFIPSAPCPARTAPANPSYEFQKFCYRSHHSGSSGAAAAIHPSFLFFLASLLMTLLIFVLA